MRNAQCMACGMHVARKNVGRPRRPSLLTLAFRNTRAALLKRSSWKHRRNHPRRRFAFWRTAVNVKQSACRGALDVECLMVSVIRRPRSCTQTCKQTKQAINYEPTHQRKQTNTNETKINKHANKHANRKRTTNKQSKRRADRQTNKQTNNQPHTQTNKQTNKQAGRQASKQTNKQQNTETGKQKPTKERANKQTKTHK